MTKTSEPLLTLEPFIDALRDGVTRAGWELSGLQKTTSQQFDGRWEGEDSRSAYLFFHCERVSDVVSIDAFLDETSKGLSGNLALVLEGPELAGLGPMKGLLTSLARVTRACLPRGYRMPITVRLRLDGPDQDPDEAESEVRLKLLIPAGAVSAGADAVSALATAAVAAFECALRHPELEPLRFGVELGD